MSEMGSVQARRDRVASYMAAKAQILERISGRLKQYAALAAEEALTWITDEHPPEATTPAKLHAAMAFAWPEVQQKFSMFQAVPDIAERVKDFQAISGISEIRCIDFGGMHSAIAETIKFQLIVPGWMEAIDDQFGEELALSWFEIEYEIDGSISASIDIPLLDFDDMQDFEAIFHEVWIMVKAWYELTN